MSFDIQAMMDDGQRERTNTQMTLGKIIKVLETLPEDTEIHGFGELDSYRGYYSDLAVAPTSEKRPVFEVLAGCRAAMGEVFTGYKGGEYVMGSPTPIWYAHYGDTGRKIIGIGDDGTIKTAKDDTV